MESQKNKTEKRTSASYVIPGKLALALAKATYMYTQPKPKPTPDAEVDYKEWNSISTDLGRRVYVPLERD